MYNSFSDVIDKFGGPATFSREIGMGHEAAKQARRRQSLAAEWFSATAAAAERLGLDEIDERLLARLAEKRRQAAQ
jgi:hypothetical protein